MSHLPKLNLLYRMIEMQVEQQRLHAAQDAAAAAAQAARDAADVARTEHARCIYKPVSQHALPVPCFIERGRY